MSLRERLMNGIRPSRNSVEDFWALDDISFDVFPGESIGIIGRNGAGKSTLLKILSKITPPTKGKIISRGRIASLLEVGTGFHPELTGRENIFFNGSLLGMKRKEIQSKFDEIVDFSGVEKFLDTPLKHYSSGMQLRLAFAVAAFLEPEILIIDEVLAVGDAEFQKKCLGKMEDVSKSGRTILFVSHNLGAVQNLCGRGVLIDQGTVVANDDVSSVAALYNKHSSKIGETQVRDRKDRRGNGVVRVSSIKLLDNKIKGSSNQIFSGQDIVFKIEYEAERNVEIKSMVIGLIVKNSNDQFLTVLNNGMSGMMFVDMPNTGQIFCRLEKNPFMHVEHLIDLNLFINGTLSDSVLSAMKFYVANSDYYESGYPNAVGRQGIYIDQDWKSNVVP